MKLLVTGRNGQVAQSLASLHQPGVEVIALGRPTLDITDRATIARAIATHQPDVIVSAAAYTAVDKAEADEAAAFAANRDGAKNVAAAAFTAALPVIHLSTDYVFPGDKEAPYTEADPTGPKSVYGRSKLAGEVAVREANPRSTILRTAWVYSPYGGNFLKTMLRISTEREMLRVVADQYGTPTYALDIAEAIVVVARHMMEEPQQQNWQGIFHMVSEGETTWAGFAEEIFCQSAARGGPYARVEPINTEAYPTPARRPANSRLDTARFRQVFEHELPAWRNGVARCLDALASE
ncbi:MAG TPA: dTDP-4-dehydrorhamnose reductase [Aurantimonas coralicida]|uniref:dTDP-4-dehydrorhamnose reductase n=2 Tax=root TaxID=1 RepID=A0A9C9NEZ9_9HYPH|nr:dTDP-4-dehydrorhamnose reductase [Aurantimonas coralicida]HEU00134.1 dTDP-4-dehydrorhamnose reductase [Aurantimonas coralicida]